MKHIINLCIFQFCCVIAYALVYYYFLRNDLKLNHDKYKHAKLVDCFMYSMAVTSGTGVSGITTTTTASSIVSMLQQGTLIAANVVTAYLFLHNHK